ncbi:MAG TPA: hypothetical protein VGN51_05590 [Acidimicrobiia bacterium]|jgi:hypothetical protein
MTDHGNDEDALRRALSDAAAHLPPLDTAADSESRRAKTAPRWRRPLVAGLAVLLLIAAVPIGAALLNEDHEHHGDDKQVVVNRIDGEQQVLQALAATVDSGSYDLEFTFHIEPGEVPSVPCARADDPSDISGGISSCGAFSQVPETDLRGHGTVNTSPYAMTVFTDLLGGITLYVNDSTVWEFGGAGYGTNGAPVGAGAAGPGSSLSGFAGLVEGTLGQGQGAQSMISLASNSGYLGLESEMVTGAKTDGTGVLDDGTHLTYYRVDVDLARMADAPTLSAEQRQAITDAIGVLRSVGYSGTDERIGVDDAGFIRDVVATTRFADGGSMTRHSVFSNFGCAKRVTMPNEAAVDAPAGTCPPAGAPTTTVPAASTSSTPPSPSTTSAPSTTPPTTTPPPTTPPTTAPPDSTTTAPTSTTTTSASG